MGITSLKYRIALTILGLEAVMMAFVLWVTLSNSLEASRQQLANTDKVTLDLLADLGRIALLTDEFAELQLHLEDAQESPHVAQVFLADEETNIVASTQPELIGSPLSIEEGSKENYWRQVEISSSSRRIGLLSIQFSNAGLIHAYENALRLGITTAAVGMSVIAIVGLIIGFLLTRRLDKLQLAAQSMAKGALNVQTHLHGADEVGKLGEAFDQMSQRITENFTSIHKNEEQLQAILDNSTAVIYLKDLEGRYILVNRQFEKLLNLPNDKIKGLTDHDIFPKSTADLFRANDLKALKATAPLQLEEPLLQTDGEHTYISIKFCLFDVRRVPYGSCGISTDITHRKRAEEDLRRAMLEVEKLKNRVEAEKIYLQDEIKVDHNFEEIIGNNPNFKNVLYQIGQVASTNSTVLILGETGTGKELIARAIHNISTRSSRALVKVNLTSIPESLIESELFGYEKGAFTGAVSRKLGRFDLADNGTLFLDEIGDLPLGIQMKLLRVLQEGEFERLGSSQTRKVDVRVIAATNRNLEEAMKVGDFREDLFYRLNVFPIKIPPLRERVKDIRVLVRHFMAKYSTRIGKKVDKITQRLMDSLQAYHWPGNVRELENLIERGIILAEGSTLDIDKQLDFQPFPTDQTGKPGTIKESERLLIRNALEESAWVVEGKYGAATRLGIAPSTLRDRMREYALKDPS